MLVSGEFTQAEIAKSLKISEQTICNWKKDCKFIKEYNALIRQTIKGVTGKALRTQENLLAAKSEMVRYLAAKDILDRAGFKAQDRIEIETSLGKEKSKLDDLVRQMKEGQN